MKRRTFLQSLAALAASPALPSLPSLSAAALPAAPVAAPTAVTAATYKWAETIVRAHDYCNLGLLQRHLNIDAAAAQMVKDRLLANGIINAQANSFGIHKAVEPLFRGAFPNPTPSAVDLAEKAKEVVEKVVEHLETGDTTDAEATSADDDGDQNEDDQNGTEILEVRDETDEMGEAAMEPSPINIHPYQLTR